MSHIRIIGVGSPFSPDHLGMQAASYLEEHLRDHYPGRRQQCELLDRPGAALLEYLKPFDGVILLIDAVVAQPGMANVASYTPETLLQQQSLSSHGFGVAETLALGENLGMLHSDIEIIGISTEAHEWQEPLVTLVDEILARD